MHLHTHVLALPVFLQTKLLHLAFELGRQLGETPLEVSLHLLLLLRVRRSQLGDLLLVLLFELGDLRVQLVDLVARVCRQTLDLALEARDLLLKLVDRGLELSLRGLRLPPSRLKSAFELGNLLLELLVLPYLVIELLLQLTLRALQLRVEPSDFDLEPFCFLL